MSWGQYTALFDAIGDWERVRQIRFPLCEPSFHHKKRDDVDKPRWTVKLEAYGTLALTSD